MEGRPGTLTKVSQGGSRKPGGASYDRVVMKNQIVAAFLILGGALAMQAGAQSAPQAQNAKSDWQVVEWLPEGTAISVYAGKHWHGCRFVGADEQSLECDATPRTPLAPISLVVPPLVYRRAEVKRVRLEDVGKSTLKGAAIGAGIGMAIGAIGGDRGGYTRGGAMAVLGGMGALVGGVIEWSSPGAHGKVIYQQ